MSEDEITYIQAPRLYCNTCNRKRERKYLVKVYYKLLQKTAYHCKEHLTTLADFMPVIMQEIFIQDQIEQP